MARKSFYERLRDIDRRLIFLFIALSVTVPLVFHLYFPEVPTPMVRGVFEQVDRLPPGSRVLIDFSYDPASMPELEPMATAFARHCLLNHHKVYITALWPLGPQLATDAFNDTVEFLRRLDPDRRIVYGEDYVNLGYKSGYQGVIKVLLTNIGALYPTDINGTNAADIPMMQGVVNLRGFDLIVSISAGFPGAKEWIQFGSTPAGVPFVTGATAVFAPLLYPYYPQQMVGILGGLKGAAEYEALLLEKMKPAINQRLADAAPGDPTDRQLVAEAAAQLGYTQKGITRMGPQAVAHLVIVAFIVLGNITFFIDRRRARGRR
jgi:hypothetical protein